jgi:CheY-like chemotaxis protein
MKQQAKSGVFTRRSKRVLIVDQDSDAAELYAIWLHREGYWASIAADATQAALVAPILKPEVAIVDVGPSTIDGIELVRELRELPELDGCHYIALMAGADLHLQDRCVAAGFGSVFEKPVLRSILLGSVLAAPLLARAGQTG